MQASDPQNIPTKLGVGDLLVREDLSSEPIEAFELLLAEVQYRGDAEHTLLVARHLLERQASHYDALAGIVDAMTDLGNGEDAVPFLEAALMEAPDDIPLRNLLVSAHENLGERTRANSVRAEISHLHVMRGEGTQARLALCPEVAAMQRASLGQNKGARSDSGSTITLDQVLESVESDSCSTITLRGAIEGDASSTSTLTLSHIFEVDTPSTPAP